MTGWGQFPENFFSADPVFPIRKDGCPRQRAGVCMSPTALAGVPMEPVFRRRDRGTPIPCHLLSIICTATIIIPSGGIIVVDQLLAFPESPASEPSVAILIIPGIAGGQRLARAPEIPLLRYLGAIFPSLQPDRTAPASKRPVRAFKSVLAANT
jgi:hypothetical protein